MMNEVTWTTRILNPQIDMNSDPFEAGLNRVFDRLDNDLVPTRQRAIDARLSPLTLIASRNP